MVKSEKTQEKRDLREILLERGDTLSKASRIRMLIAKQKGFWRAKKKLTSFNEPVLFLTRRSGKIDFYENASSGKFVFEHSDGKQRYIELRPSDQGTLNYGDKQVRCYQAHEDRPFSGYENPINDTESVALSMEKIKKTDLKYQERLASLANKGKLTWVWIILGIAGAIAIIGFAYMTWIQPALEKKAIADAQIAIKNAPTAGLILLSFGKKKWGDFKQMFK